MFQYYFNQLPIADQIKELQTCLTELTDYMTRDTKFVPPPTTSELCSAAKQFIVSNHAVSIAEMESKHMLEINQLKVGISSELKPDFNSSLSSILLPY